MPEPPDFEQMARALCQHFDGFASTDLRAVAEQLRLIWNARGAADIVKLQAEFSTLFGATAAGQSMKLLERALRTLDR